MLKRSLLILPAAAALALCIAALRTALAPPTGFAAVPASTLPVDVPAAALRLAAAVRFKTISREGADARDDTELPALIDYLRASYPHVFAQLQRQDFPGQGLLLRWPGRDAQALPVLLAAHLDVVPVEAGTEGTWQHAPFSGDIADGYIWGRGTLDDKGVALPMLEAAEAMLAAGQQPRRTLYLAFGGDEEIGGEHGARAIAAQLRHQGVKLDYVLDEGLAITDGFIAGLREPAALIGIAQKGYATFALSATGPGGHSSIPEDRNPLVLVARAVARIAAAPPPLRLTMPVRQMLAGVSPQMPPLLHVALGNLWLSAPLVKRVLAAKPATRALLQTVVSPTVFRSGEKDNIVPQQASAEINARILPGDSVEQVRQHFVSLADDPRVVIALKPGSTEPTPVSDSANAAYRSLAGAIRATYPDVVVAPGLVLALTDSRHYVDLAADIYRFGPLRLKPEDLARIHGSNERVSVQDYAASIRFFATLMAAP
ncbi:MAG TPA: M20/M25/M40 family metallo-hydrolase [Nevskia sp.]|nr:M20/M25/M40 family metallo-hydrolase [Nevskia sp.]